MKYRHTNLVAQDWRELATFYERSLGCRRIGPERSLSGRALSLGTGIRDAALEGVHLLLPGYGESGPTLEIFQYATGESNLPPQANRKGLGHIAFEVESVEAATQAVLLNGGSRVGEICSIEVEGAGVVTFAYLADPEGNLIELQSWNETGKGPGSMGESGEGALDESRR